MKNKLLLAFLVGLFLIGTSGIGNALTIDINSAVNSPSNSITVPFLAGTYDVTPIAGTYIAWEAWDNKIRWVNKYGLSSDEFSPYNVWDGANYETQQEALDNALSTSFVLTYDQDVNFFIEDSNYSDNSGGITLDVTMASVPEPATILLFGTGLVGLAGFGRKRVRK